jgi:hypothetical protein
MRALKDQIWTTGACQNLLAKTGHPDLGCLSILLTEVKINRGTSHFVKSMLGFFLPVFQSIDSSPNFSVNFHINNWFNPSQRLVSLGHRAGLILIQQSPW